MMSGPADVPPASHTTSAEDQANVARLQARLEGASATSAAGTGNTGSNDPSDTIPAVEIAPGAHKYVQITGEVPSCDGKDTDACTDVAADADAANAETATADAARVRTFVVSKKGAQYHANAAEPFVDRLEAAGYRNIRVRGGGRINYDPDNRTIAIFGYSYGFGLADHALSKRVIEEDGRFLGYGIDWSNDGY